MCEIFMAQKKLCFYKKLEKPVQLRVAQFDRVSRFNWILSIIPGSMTQMG